MEAQAGQIPLPQGTGGIVPLPPLPAILPTDTDLCHAMLFYEAAKRSYYRRELNNAQFADAMKYKDKVVSAVNTTVDAVADNPPAWFLQALHTNLQPIRADITEMRNNITEVRNDIAWLKRGLVAVQRHTAIMFNSKLAIGSTTPLIEVPWPDGTYPWTFIYRNAALPPLTSANVVRNLSRHESRRYHEGYYPGEEIPGENLDRCNAILRAIGCVDPYLHVMEA